MIGLKGGGGGVIGLKGGGEGSMTMGLGRLMPAGGRQLNARGSQLRFFTFGLCRVVLGSCRAADIENDIRLSPSKATHKERENRLTSMHTNIIPPPHPPHFHLPRPIRQLPLVPVLVLIIFPYPDVASDPLDRHVDGVCVLAAGGEALVAGLEEGDVVVEEAVRVVGLAVDGGLGARGEAAGELAGEVGAELVEDWGVGRGVSGGFLGGGGGDELKGGRRGGGGEMIGVGG